jgi:hypothetical protein
MSNKEKILECFPLATIKNQYYGLFIALPIADKQELIDLLSDYNLPITGAVGNDGLSFYVTIAKY